MLQIQGRIELQPPARQLMQTAGLELGNNPDALPVRDGLLATTEFARQLHGAPEMSDGDVWVHFNANSTASCTLASSAWYLRSPKLYRMARRYKTKLAERLAQVMSEMGWNQVQLAKAAKCSKQAVTNWMNGHQPTISAEYALNLQDATGKFEARWILEGKGPTYRLKLDPEGERLFAAIEALPIERRRAFFALLDL